jgi:hypothetical protein
MCSCKLQALKLAKALESPETHARHMLLIACMNTHDQTYRFKTNMTLSTSSAQRCFPGGRARLMHSVQGLLKSCSAPPATHRPPEHCPRIVPKLQGTSDLCMYTVERSISN